MNILKELLSISQSLDEKGLVALASRLDSVAEEMSKEEGQSKVLSAMISLRDSYMLSEGLTFKEALTKSIIDLYGLSEANAEAVSGFTKDLVDNGLDTKDALETSISEVLRMVADLPNAEIEDLAANKRLLAELGLDEAGRKLDNINYEDSPLLIEQLEMINPNDTEKVYN